MQWKALTADEVKGLQLAKATQRNIPYAEIFAAVDNGPVQVDVPENSNLQALKSRLSRAIRKADVKIAVATLADKTGVVLTKVKDVAEK